jgi:hypothetical protein
MCVGLGWLGRGLCAPCEVLEKMGETESPFLMGIESMPWDEMQELLLKMEKAASLANSAVADAHKYVSSSRFMSWLSAMITRVGNEHCSNYSVFDVRNM